MKIKYILPILIVVCLMFSACDWNLQYEPPENRYQYTISTSFVETSDVEAFKKRLSACGFHVSDHEVSDGQHRFVLYSQYGWNEDCLKLLGQNFEASVVDKDGNSLVTDADVLNMEYSRVSLKLNASADLNRKLQEECDTRTLSLVVDGSITNAAAYFDNAERLSFAIPREDGPADLCKTMIAFSKAPLTEEIEIEVLPLK